MPGVITPDNVNQMRYSGMHMYMIIIAWAESDREFQKAKLGQRMIDGYLCDIGLDAYVNSSTTV